MKNETGEVLRLSSSMVGDEETNFSHKLLLTNRQVKNIRKVFSNKSLTDIKLSKTQSFKTLKLGGFLGSLVGPLLKTELSLIMNVIKPLCNNVLIPLRLPAAPSAADAGIHKKFLGSGHSSAQKKATLILLNDKMKGILEIVKSLEDSGLLLKELSETI